MRGTYVLNSLVLATARRDYMRFRNEMPRAEVVQNRTLEQIVGRNTGSVFGQQHGLAGVTNYAAFARLVPIRGYEEFWPFIRQIEGPGSPVLTEEKTRLFEPTSGSNPATKFIPYTSNLQREFYRAINPWLIDVYQRHPRLLNGRSYWSISPAVTRSCGFPTTVPVGFEDDSAYLSRLSRAIVEKTFVTPRSLKRETDRQVFFTGLSLNLLAASDLALVSIWNPNAFLMLLDFISENRETLLQSLTARTGGPDIPRISRTREVELRRIFRSEPPAFAEVWRNLGFLSCWADGANRAYAERLQSLFPETEIQGKGLIATEGIVSIPFEGHSYLPAYQSHFFEFLPEGEETECLRLHQLKDGARYRVVLTTSGGLYRYRLGDIVAVTGYHAGLPLIQFVARDSVLDHFGEKLHLGHVQTAVEKTIAAFDQPPFALLAFESDGDSGAYCLFLQIDGASSENATARITALRRAMESALKENYHYEHALDMRQIRPLKVFVIEVGAMEAYFRRLNEEGVKVGDIKTEVVSPLPDWSSWFHGRFQPD